MKYLLTTVGLLAGTHTALCQTGTVVFQVERVNVTKGGDLSAGVFREADFPKVGKQAKSIEVPVTASKMEFRLLNVPTGSYGAAVFQDINRDKDLQTNFLGLPTEPIGFSNDARIRFGPPAFQDARFQVEENQDVIIKIILR